MEKRRNRPIRELTDEETQYAEDALEEYREKGSSSKRCPVCGGNFAFTDNPSGYSVVCENPDCDFRYTVRGL